MKKHKQKQTQTHRTTATAAPSDRRPGCRIRHRDTGGMRELTAAQWDEDGDRLTAEGYRLVDDHDQPVP